jgi:hypothetical protein
MLLLLHRFMFWLADSAEGKVYLASSTPTEVTANTNITVNTAERYLDQLFGAFNYYNQALPMDLKRSARYWIKNDLARELDLNRERYSKTIGYHQDVEQMISAIWDFKALAVIKSIRAMFNCTLLINLLIDGASRIGEFLPKDSLAHDQQKFLQWQHLEFFALPDEGSDAITIFIIVTCEWLKNQTHNIHGFKKFTIFLLSPNFAFQDTCRMLVILALHKGLFKHFRTWEELMSCTPSPDGSPILLKESFLEDPVLTSTTAETNDANVEVPSYVHLVSLLPRHRYRGSLFRCETCTLSRTRRGSVGQGLWIRGCIPGLETESCEPARVYSPPMHLLFS